MPTDAAMPDLSADPSRAELAEHCRSQLAALRALAEEMTDSEWASATLCDGWTAKDVYAHLLAGREVGVLGLAAGVVRHRGMDRWSDVVSRRLAASTPTEELVRRFAAETSRWPERGIARLEANAAKLADNVTHELDIRRVTGRSGTIPAGRLAAALSASFRTNMWGTKRRVERLRFEATDLPWHRGRGQLVAGPGEDLLLAINGRPAGLDALRGEGVAVLRERLGSPS